MESNNKIFTETIGTSSIAKTMRNSLVPTESTKRNIEKNGIIIDAAFHRRDMRAR